MSVQASNMCQTTIHQPNLSVCASQVIPITFVYLFSLPNEKGQALVHFFFLLCLLILNLWHLLKWKSFLSVSAEPKEIKTVPKEAPAKARPPAKAPAKPLPELMEEDVIPSLKAILEAQADVSNIELSFQDDRVSFYYPHFSFTNQLLTWAH